MNDIYISVTDDLNYLAHNGVPGMSWRTHKFGKWQNHAVYARNNKQYIKGKSEEEIQKSTYDKLSAMTSTSNDELDKDLKRLQKENDYMQAVKRRGELEREYNRFLAQPKVERDKQFKNKINTIYNLTYPLRMALSGYIKYEAYDALRDLFDKETAEAVINGRVGDGKPKRK